MPVDRSNARASLKSMMEAARIISERGVSVLNFPEGGRSAEGLREFKEGPAYIAIKAGVPVVPVAIVGMRELLPMGSIHLRSGRVVLRVGDPIATKGMEASDRVELTERLYREVSRLLGVDWVKLGLWLPSRWRRLAVTLCFLAALPAADFTTYIGDTNDYRVARVLADAAGNTYVAGSRDGGMFVMKLDAAGKIVLFATLSGKGTDQPNDLAVDAAGNLYLAGATTSALLPLRNALQSTPGPGFVVKFSPDATQIALLDLLSSGDTGAGAGCGGQSVCHGLHLLRRVSGHAGLAGGDGDAAGIDQRHVRRLPHQDLRGRRSDSFTRRAFPATRRTAARAAVAS